MNKLKSHLGDIRTQVVILAILFIAAYYVPFRSMVSIWWENVDYSYGFLIPVVSAYLFWEKRKTFGGIPIRSAWWILPVLVLFILISLYGILGSSGNVSMPSIPILIILFMGFCFGIESVKRLILPLGFLFLMVPVPDIIERNILVYLKAVSTRLGGAFIGLFNIPVHVSGNVIDLGAIQLQVVDACSGLRYIFPLFALGILFAYFFERVAWKRLFCVLVTIPLGVFLNALRIGVTGVLTDMFGPEVSEGFFHGFSGFVVFVLALIILFLISRILRAFSPKTAASKWSNAPEPGHDATFTVERKKTTGAFLLSVAVLSCVAALSLSTGTLPAVAIEGGIRGFPLLIGEWKGRPETVDPVIIKESGAEEAFSGYFINGSGSEITLYMGYRSTAFLANDNFFHSPTVCIPSSGWVEQEVKRRTITNVPYFNNLDVTKMVIEKGGIRQLVYFWFQTKDEATYDKNINRFHLSLHAIRRDNTHDLFMRPITAINPGEGIEDAEIRMDGFVREMMPVLLQFLKEKQVRKIGGVF
ncbi:MAG: EpsI family protein [Deltaproteobacteria bacterium]|nr:EpsI family protein [Deltaproteobacteria bacterium]